MGLEEHTLEHMRKTCESCGASLTDAEISAAIEAGGDFLCGRCASEQVPLEDQEEED